MSAGAKIYRWSAAALVMALFGTVSAPTTAIAHEGHAPLPTKGATVDVERGALVLSADAHKALGVKTAEVKFRNIEEEVLAYATVELSWQQHRYVTTPIAGRITRLHVQSGQAVSVGQELAEVESTELENLQLGLLDAENKAKLSATTLDRVRRLAKDQVIAQQELIEAANEHQENLNSIAIARSRLKRLRLSEEQIDAIIRDGKPLRSLSIHSPLAGIAIHTDLAIGKFIAPSEHLFEVIDLSSVMLRIDVLEHDLAKLEQGQRVEVSLSAFPESPFSGKIEVIEKYLDPITHLGRAWASLPNSSDDRKLLPGMYGQATVVLADGEKLAVPREALLSNGTETFVLVEEAATARATEYRKRNVALGRRTREFVELAAGDIFPGDRVVTTGAHELSNFFIQGVLRLSPEARRNLGVRVEAVGVENVQDILEVDGAVDLPPEQRAEASSQLDGTIEAIYVERGQTVGAGQVIAEVASLELQQVQLELLQAHLQSALLEDTLKRLRQLGNGQAIARKRLLETESLYRSAVMQRDNARARLERVGLSRDQLEKLLSERTLVDLLPIRAPIDGTIVQFSKRLGQVIRAEEPLFEIHNLSHVLVRADLSERDASSVTVGTSARIRFVAQPTFLAEGVVVRSGSTFDVANRTLSVWIELKDQPAQSLFHGMLARITFALENSQQSLAVPKEAIARAGTRSFVFVQGVDGVLHRRAVELGRSDDRYVEIKKGLESGELVAVQGAAALQTAFASLR